MKSITYKDAGVNIEKGEKAVKNIKTAVKSTFNKNVLTEIGGFGGLYSAGFENLEEPVLVSSVDGVGTKLKIAFLMNKHDTIGQDLVNHCVNDIAVGGAQPLFFLDYFATGKLNEHVFNDVIAGFVKGCKHNNCALIGGETAEMPEIYQNGEYDMSGTIVGVAEKARLITGDTISGSEILIGVNSNGMHTNGYSLARKVLLRQYKINDYFEELNATLGQELLRIHISYLKLIEQICAQLNVKGIAHITGGGIENNTKRILPAGLKLKVDWQAWEWLPIFSLIQSLGKVPVKDMRKTFNLGIGLIFIVESHLESTTREIIKQNGFSSYVVGEITK